MAKKPYVWVEQAVVIAALRRTTLRYPPNKEVRLRARREWFQDCKNGNKRLRVSYECEKCKTTVPAKLFKIDHISPVVSPIEGFVDYNTYAKRLYCPIENLQGICKTCHDEKSKLEKKERRKNYQNKP